MRECRCSGLVLVLLLLAGAVGVAGEADLWRAVFDRPEDLAVSDGPLVCVLNIQHPDVIRKQLASQAPDQFAWSE